MVKHLKQLKIFLMASFLLGLVDVFLTNIALTYGLREFSPLHNALGVNTLLSHIIAIIVIPIIIYFGSLICGRKVYPHILVLIQLLNVTGNAIIILLLTTGKLIVPI